MTDPGALDVDRLLRETFVAHVEHHALLTSTNDRAATLASGECRLPLLVVADEQTAGRGRGANRWWTGQRSLAMSLLAEAETVGAQQSPAPLVALATAVAVAETVAPRVRPHAVGIHWPNDVIAAGRKVAGILVEVLPDRRHVIGVGLNTNNRMADAPESLRPTAVTLRDLTGEVHDPTSILVELLRRLETRFVQLAAAPEHVAAIADQLCLQRGATLALRQGDRTVTGRCLGIAPDGALVLATAAGRRSFCCGTIES